MIYSYRSHKTMKETQKMKSVSRTKQLDLALKNRIFCSEFFQDFISLIQFIPDFLACLARGLAESILAYESKTIEIDIIFCVILVNDQ